MPDSSRTFPNPFLWPVLAAATASATSASFFNSIADALSRYNRSEPGSPAPLWATPNKVVLELPSMRLRDFSTQALGPATLICAPYALHGATVADFAPGHSVVEALLGAGVDRVLVTDWRSATPEMCYFSIDSYLADLNVAIDEIGPPVDLVGLCQGGWMALLYAARFPAKVRRLVLAGAPVDVRAAESHLSRLTADLPFSAFENLVRIGAGRVLGKNVLALWEPALAADDASSVLQLEPNIEPQLSTELEGRFRQWTASTVDLPGVYYLQVVLWLYQENRIVEGSFVALGRPVDLANIRAPAYLLAARDDELVSPDQLFSTARLIGRPKAIEMATEPCGHLSLFLGARTIGGAWRRIAQWISDPVTTQRSEARHRTKSHP